MKGPENYSAGLSPCCGAQGHRPNSTGSFFCMDCGTTFEDKSVADEICGPGTRRDRKPGAR